MLTDEMKEAARMISEGKSAAEAAGYLKIRTETVEGWLQNGEMLDYTRELLRIRQIVSYARASRKVEEMMEDDSAAVLQKAVHEALERFEDALNVPQTGEITVRVVGGPEIGMAGEDKDAEPRPVLRASADGEKETDGRESE